MVFKAVYHTSEHLFLVSWYRGLKVSFLIVSAFCDQIIAKQSVESCTGKRNLEISLGIVWEKCTERFYIVGSEGFHAMH